MQLDQGACADTRPSPRSAPAPPHIRSSPAGSNGPPARSPRSAQHQLTADRRHVRNWRLPPRTPTEFVQVRAQRQDHRGSVLLANYFSAILAALRLATCSPSRSSARWASWPARGGWQGLRRCLCSGHGGGGRDDRDGARDPLVGGGRCGGDRGGGSATCMPTT